MKLKKELNVLDVFCIVAGAMISSGLFILPGIAHAIAGPAVVFSYFLAGVFACAGMFSQAELVSAMPKSGGTYFYVTRSMGNAAGTIDGLMTWCSLSLKTAFALVGMAAFTEMFVAWDIRLISLGLTVFFVALNIVGIKEVGRLQRVLVLGLLSILMYYVVRGFPHVDVHNFEPFAPYGASSVLATAGFVFVAFGGLLKVCSVAEEVKNPEETIPIGMISALFVVTIIYTAVVFVTSGVLGAEELDHSLTPISSGAYAFGGKTAMLWLGFAAILAFVSTANAGIMAASRYPMALAKDGLLPDNWSNINRRFKTPHVAIMITGIFISVSVFFDLTVLVKLASSVLILTFLFSCLAVIIMRESLLQNYNPKFKSPFYPWVQIAGIVGYSAMLIGMGTTALVAVLVFVTSGFFVYWFYGRIRTNREFALLHLVERITAKELTSRSLETELKEIIQERDDIAKDRFDVLIEHALVVDFDEDMELNEFFKKVSELMSPRLNVDKRTIFGLLCERESDTSTVIGPGIAVPHIIVEGTSVFELLLVRCKGGINFPESTYPVHTVFVLAGSKDERNFHLRSLAAIAQILQEKGFEEKWLAAKDKESLRDLLLLGKRKR